VEGLLTIGGLLTFIVGGAALIYGVKADAGYRAIRSLWIVVGCGLIALGFVGLAAEVSGHSVLVQQHPIRTALVVVLAAIVLSLTVLWTLGLLPPPGTLRPKLTSSRRTLAELVSPTIDVQLVRPPISDRAAIEIHNAGPTGDFRVEVVKITGALEGAQYNWPWYLGFPGHDSVDTPIVTDGTRQVTVVLYGSDPKPFVFPGPEHFTRKYARGEGNHEIKAYPWMGSSFDVRIRISRVTAPIASIERTLRISLAGAAEWV
jgi:hypothetical protein